MKNKQNDCRCSFCGNDSCKRNKEKQAAKLDEKVLHIDNTTVFNKEDLR